jgi:hypothetical protein
MSTTPTSTSGRCAPPRARPRPTSCCAVSICAVLASPHATLPASRGALLLRRSAVSLWAGGGAGIETRQWGDSPWATIDDGTRACLTDPGDPVGQGVGHERTQSPER